MERERTGLGQHIDVSQLETGLHFLAPEILEYTVNGRIPPRRGNADPQMAPHGVYPCAGDDRWCAIVCETDRDWTALARAMGSPSWATDPSLATAAGRLARAADVDRRIAEWTEAQDPHALMATLQAVGVPAGAVQSCADLQRDPGLAAREALPIVEHPEMGRTAYEAWAFRAMGCPQVVRRAPCLGEHTIEVLRDVLGLSQDEIGRLEAAGILA
jgi:benzylsuccinate CoA-transferase BbsF subunit